VGIKAQLFSGMSEVGFMVNLRRPHTAKKPRMLWVSIGPPPIIRPDTGLSGQHIPMMLASEIDRAPNCGRSWRRTSASKVSAEM
jgi:hypothetical protein